MKVDIKKIRSQLNKRQHWIFVSGIVCLLFGLWRFIFLNPSVGINLAKLQPVISNGTLAIILGGGLLVGWYLTKKQREKIIKKEIEEIRNKDKPDEEYGW
jgi:hypothetical protein